MEQLLTTKLYIPPTRPVLVPRPRLIKQINEGLDRKLTLISAPAGFGKTTLVTEWLDVKNESQVENKIAWLSLDEGDNDPARFLSYFITSLIRIEAIESAQGKGLLGLLQSPQPTPTEAVLTSLINEIAAIPDKIILVLDDYHLIDAQPIHDALSFLLENIPPQLHLVIATREDPHLPLARLRVRSQMTELRATDLRFTSSEAAEFLNQVMGLDLSTEDIAALETRTEGWIAGLQLAAISLQGHADTSRLIQSFTGSNRLVLDYLIEEVLDQQPENVQTFLLQTAILDRLCGSLCDALTGQNNSQAILEILDNTNLFIVPLDNERRWYRYHHLFADLLRQRLHQSSAGDEGRGVAGLHNRASVWFEDNGLEIEAFQHAAAANDFTHAERLIEGVGLPLYWRGAATPVLNWLESLPTTVLDARPSLWVTYASTLVFAAQSSGVEEKLQFAEAALGDAEPDEKPQDLFGRIAALRSMMAVPQHQIETIMAQANRALELLNPENLTYRTAATWTLGYAYEVQGNRAAASRAYTDVISISQASGNFMFTLAATTSLGNIQEAENQLHLAAETQRRALQMAGDPPVPFACASHLGLARIFYEWNDLDAAQLHAEQSVQLAQQIEGVDTPAACELLLARIKLAQGDVDGASAFLAQADQFVRQHNFVHMSPEVVAIQVLISLRHDDLAAAAHLTEKHELPINLARVHLAQGDSGEALALLEPLRRQAESRDLEDERLKVMVLQAVALHAHDETEKAVRMLGDALALGEPGGFIRTFVDEGPPMARLLYEALNYEIAPDYVQRLLAAFPTKEPERSDSSKTHAPHTELIEPLSKREIEVLQLISEGLTNQEVATRLHLSLYTVKAHARNIYTKFGVENRIQAVAKGKALGILSPT
ncbi:LuxR C-terminal-related transcriptional regulator [Chloroflexota bacterium]